MFKPGMLREESSNKKKLYNPPAVQETQQTWSGLSLQEKMIIHSSNLVILPEKFHGQGSLAGYNPKGRRVGHNRATKHIPS